MTYYILVHLLYLVQQARVCYIIKLNYELLKGIPVEILTAPRMERCIGCHSCSLACARLVHKRLSWDEAGIRIHTSGGLSTGFEAKTCLACNPAPCAAVCPTGAFSQRKGGGVVVRKRLCIRCGECAKACPVDAVYLDPSQEPFVCIHCGRCVSFCPHDCLEMVASPGGQVNEGVEKEVKNDTG
jgi:Fe-S-cluster-containing hydrogenase component 2